MYLAVVIIHVIVSIFLIAVILLQAGRGGGLADSFGGSQIQSILGTKSANILTKLTTICAVSFIMTCLTLALISGQRTKSLVEKIDLPAAATQQTTLPVDIEDTGAEESTEAPISEAGAE